MTALERFLNYISVNTRSGENSGVRPSSSGQQVLANRLSEEMRQLGLQDVYIAEADGAVFGTIPANTKENLPVLGFLAHMDTSPSASGENVRPRIVKNYDGGTIFLNESVSMSPEEGFSCLRDVIGEDLIVTDGFTLLGADDKAGIAEIMTMAEELLHSDKQHGVVKVGFTSDEEIGAGPALFDVKRFGCNFAYTVDGGPLGELEFENFNAASATVTVSGVGVHPGNAKNLMKNACAIAAEFQNMLPAEQTPEHTEGYEGFFCLMGTAGTVTETKLHYILRDHDLKKLRDMEQFLSRATEFLNVKYGDGTVSVDIRETYYNMRTALEPHMHLIDTARIAFQKQGVIPINIPIRGGTDGALLSYMGLPCPNLSSGGYQFHGIYEFIPVRALETMPKVLLEITYAYGGGTIDV